MLRAAPSSTLFPYTTLFRSRPRASFSGVRPALLLERWRTHERIAAPLLAGVLALLVLFPRLGTFGLWDPDRKSTRLNSSHLGISYAVFCLKKKQKLCRNYTG